MKLSELQNKNIITEDGKLVGKIIDVNLTNTGTIESLVVEKYKFLLSLFSNKDESVVKWEQIITIGDDVILIHL